MEDFWQDEVLERQISHEKRKRQLTSRHQRAATELPPAARQQPPQQPEELSPATDVLSALSLLRIRYLMAAPSVARSSR